LRFQSASHSAPSKHKIDNVHATQWYNGVFFARYLARFRFPDIQAKVVPLMKDYLLALRSKDDTPSPLLMTSRTSEEDVLDSFKAEIAAKQAGR
jgi:hypothetical protein